MSCEKCQCAECLSVNLKELKRRYEFLVSRESHLMAEVTKKEQIIRNVLKIICKVEGSSFLAKLRADILDALEMSDS